MNETAAASFILNAYLSALHDRDLERLDALIGDSSLLENPFLNPVRLVGKREIEEAHRQIFDNLELIEIDIDRCLDDGGRAIASGGLAFARSGESRQDFDLGLVAEINGRYLRRLSLYCDTRNIRRWCDRSIL